MARAVRSPTVLQMEAVECGAASLAMVLGHHGRFVPLEKLRVDCGVTRDGSNALSLLRAARNYGMEAKGFRTEPEKLHEIGFPSIVFWDFNHFLVVDGIRPDGSVQLNDPGGGRRRVTAEEFDRSFTGVALSFSPTGEFERGGSPPRALTELRRRFGGHSAAVGLVLLLSLLLVVPGLAVPGFLRVFVDQVLGAGRDGTVLPLIGLMVGVGALLAVLTLAQQHYLLRLETRIAVDSSGSFLRHVLRLPVTFFGQRQAADIAGRVASNDTVAQLLSRDLALATLSAIVAALYAIVLFSTDLLLAGIGVGIALLNLVVLRIVAGTRSNASKKLEQDRGRLLATTYAGVQMMETIKATGRELEFFRRWGGFHARVLGAAQSLAVPTQLLNAVPVVLATVNSAFILLIGSRRVLDGAITVGSLVAFQVLMTSFTKPVNDLSALGSRLQEASADLARLADVERYGVAREFESGEEQAPVGHRLSGSLELVDVTFGYDPFAAPLIENLSLRLEPGARVAFVGGSGSGKSTVARLIAGLMDPWSGSVRFDGRDRREISRQTLAASLAVVDQEIFLFEGTIRENLTLWSEDIPDDVLVAAIEDAAVLDDVMSRPGGLDGRVLEGGRNLSGGQRQRLEIARALVGAPTLLVLDEATSALDTATERHIDMSLRRRGCASVIVAHRLSTIRDADEILVFSEGKVVERGTHDELHAAGGRYAELIRAA